MYKLAILSYPFSTTLTLTTFTSTHSGPPPLSHPIHKPKLAKTIFRVSPITNPTIPSSSAQRLARWRRRFFTMPFRIAILLCLSFIVLFILSVIAAHTTWTDYQDSLQDWTKTICEIIDADQTTDVGRCRASYSGNNEFRADVFIENVEDVPGTIKPFNPLEDEKGRVVASQTSQRCIYSAEKEANDYADRFKDKRGGSIPCYTNGELVRLTPGGYESTERTMRRLRAIFAIIASIVAAIAVLYAAHHFRVVASHSMRQTQTQQPPDISRVSRAARPPHVYRRPLSVADTQMLVSSLPEGNDGGTCPICLEEFSDDSRITRTLPCGHAYHEECALQWFRKGHATCPYCNHDLGDEVQRLRDAEDQQAREQQPIDDTSGSSGLLDTAYWPPQWNRRSSNRRHIDSGS